MLHSSSAVAVCTVLATMWLLRVLLIRARGRSNEPAGKPPVHTMAVLGSGGHTAEMIALLRTLDVATYAPRNYVVATSDDKSGERIETFEAERVCASHSPQHRLLWLPRSREVGQSYWSSALTTLYALAHAFVLVLRIRPSLLLCNGPGTCIPICIAAYALRMLGIK